MFLVLRQSVMRIAATLQGKERPAGLARRTVESMARWTAESHSTEVLQGKCRADEGPRETRGAGKMVYFLAELTEE